MHLIYYGGGGILDLHGLPPLISWMVVIGSFLGCVLFLWAWTVRRDYSALQRRVRQLEADLDHIAPRVFNPPD